MPETSRKDYWNRVAEDKSFTTPLPLEEFAALTPRDGAILDIGCGYGRVLAELAAHGFTDLRGLDFSEAMIARGMREFPGLDLAVRTGPDTGLPDESMDAVILFAVLTCIPDDDEQAALLAEAGRVLKPGGLLHVNDFLLNDDDRNLRRYAESEGKHGPYGCFELSEGAVLRHHSPDYLRRLLGDFRTLVFRETVFTTMNGNRSRGVCYFGRKPGPERG